MIYVKKATSNEGAYSVRLDEDPARYVEITTEPQGFPDDVAKHLLQTHEKFVVQVNDPTADETPVVAPSGRLKCPASGCEKTYANETTLNRHINATDNHK